jgi:hypothetical protein
MANQPDQDNEANPIAEIFDEMFTLLQDLETRSAAMLEYMKEQGGITDEKLAPYLDRAGAASDVRWRAARTRMEHLLAPKPKSATEVGKDEKQERDSPQQTKEKAQSFKPESKEVGKELASTQPGTAQEDRSKEANAADAKLEKTESSNHKQNNEPSPASTTVKTQASALGGAKPSEAQESERNPETKQSDFEKPQTQKAAS